MSKLTLLLFVIVVCHFVVAKPTADPQNSKRYQQNRGTSTTPASVKILYKNDRLYKNYNYSSNWSHNNNFLKNYKPGVVPSKARIAQQDFVQKRNGGYSYGYEAENGIEMEEHGEFVKEAPNEEETKVVHGFYSYITPEGIRVSVKYTADKNGFHPVITYDGPSAKRLANQPRPADVIINRIDPPKTV